MKDSKINVSPSLKWTGYLFLAFLVFLVASGVHHFITGGWTSDDERKIHQRLIEEINAGKTTIHLKEATGFSWERVCYFLPYLVKQHVEARIGFSYPNLYSDVSWSEHDGFWTLLFLRDASHVVAIRIPRTKVGDYAGSNDRASDCARRNVAILQVIPQDTSRGLAPRKLVLRESQ
jgi:hypothetical protein